MTNESEFSTSNSDTSADEVMQFGEINRYLFLGGGKPHYNVAVPLARSGKDVRVITSPRLAQEQMVDTDLHSVPLLEALRAEGIPCHVCADPNKDGLVHDMVTDTTLGISGGSIWIFNEAFINLFKGRLVNLHGHRLPFYRGGIAGYSWDIMDRQPLGGCTIYMIDRGISTGDVLAFEEFPYPDQCRTPDDYSKLHVSKETILLNQFIAGIEAGKEFPLIRQSEQKSRYWPQLNTRFNGYIDWSWNLEDLEAYICAFDQPYDGAATFINDRKVHLRSCFVEPTEGKFHPFKTGIIYRKSTNELHVAASQGALVIREVNDDNGVSVINEMRLGDRFYTPRDVLDAALRYRPIYTSEGLKNNSNS